MGRMNSGITNQHLTSYVIIKAVRVDEIPESKGPKAKP